MIMRGLSILLVSTALGAGAIGAAVKLTPASVPQSISFSDDHHGSRVVPALIRVGLRFCSMRSAAPIQSSAT